MGMQFNTAKGGTGAATGAVAGAAGGPIGMAIGAGVGALGGLEKQAPKAAGGMMGGEAQIIMALLGQVMSAMQQNNQNNQLVSANQGLKDIDNGSRNRREREKTDAREQHESATRVSQEPTFT